MALAWTGPDRRRPAPAGLALAAGLAAVAAALALSAAAETAPAEAAIATAEAAQTAAGASAPLVLDGQGPERRIVDSGGRAVILRGPALEAAAGRPPCWPVEPADAELAAYRRAGASAVLLAVPWSNLETEPKQLDAEAVARLRRFLDAAARNTLLVVLENFQHRSSPAFGGCGVPAWGVRPGRWQQRDPVASRLDRVLNGPSRMAAWADFWLDRWRADDWSLQDHLVECWSALAQALADHPALAGYNLLAAPERPPLSLYLARPVRREFESECLADFYRRLGLRLQAADPRALLFMEAAPRDPLREKGGGPGGRLALPALERAVFAARLPRPLPGWSPAPARRRAQAERFLELAADVAGARFDCPWVVVGWEPEIGAGSLDRYLAGGFAPEALPGSEPAAQPERIAGRPLACRAGSGPGATFELELAENGAAGPSVIFVPGGEGSGRRIEVSDGSWRWDPDDPQRLLWSADPARPEHRITISAPV